MCLKFYTEVAYPVRVFSKTKLFPPSPDITFRRFIFFQFGLPAKQFPKRKTIFLNYTSRPRTHYRYTGTPRRSWTFLDWALPCMYTSAQALAVVLVNMTQIDSGGSVRRVRHSWWHNSFMNGPPPRAGTFELFSWHVYFASNLSARNHFRCDLHRRRRSSILMWGGNGWFWSKSHYRLRNEFRAIVKLQTGN